MPIGVTFFLISSPMVDLGSLLLLVGVFGWKVAVAYVGVDFVIAVLEGTPGYGQVIEGFIKNAGGKGLEVPALTQRERLRHNLRLPGEH